MSIKRKKSAKDYNVKWRCLLKRYRLQNEMTQIELANILGVTRQTVAAIEKAKYNPSLVLAYKISRVFGVRIEDIFQFEEAE